MDLSRALGQLADIHQQIAKAEVYRGYRSLPIAASGVMGFAAAWAQTPALGASDPVGFVVYWAAIAACAGFVGASEIIYNYVVHDDRIARRRTRQVVGQFLPSLLAGAAITVSFVHLSATLVPLLPGLWAICFGIGTFASRPYLPRASGWIALFYYAAGVALLWLARGPEPLSGWWVGGTFGTGQLLAALVLYWNLEREDGAPGFYGKEKD
jgi:TctA family transporter